MNKKHSLRRLAQLGTLAIGLAVLVAGLARGEGALVMQRAIRVCLECMGLG